MSDNKTTISIRNIEVGKFYFIHDGSKTGHPGFVVWKDDVKNRYIVVRFDSDKKGEVSKKEKGVKHITKLKHPTSNSVLNSYVHNRPMVCKRKDIGIELPNLVLHKDDESLINEIAKKNCELGPSLRK